MRWSRLMHLMSILLAIAGALALCGAWVAGERGTMFGLSQTHLYADATVLTLIGIAASACTQVRMQLERDHPGSSPLV